MIIKVDEENEEVEENHVYSNLPLQQQQKPIRDQEKKEDNDVVPYLGEDIPYLYNLPSGSNIFSYFQPKGAFGN